MAYLIAELVEVVACSAVVIVVSYNYDFVLAHD